ncbi:MAG: hypothetical protein K0M55_19450 [Rhizobium sp.]|nr:hypothetical protein [Rhizobium sp.]
MSSKVEHPCLNCTLPDCNEASKSCALRVALNRYDNCKRKGLPISEEIRRQNSMAWQELYLPGKRERAALRRHASPPTAPDASEVDGKAEACDGDQIVEVHFGAFQKTASEQGIVSKRLSSPIGVRSPLVVSAMEGGA